MKDYYFGTLISLVETDYIMYAFSNFNDTFCWRNTPYL